MADFLNKVKVDEQLFYKESIGVEDGVMVEMTVKLQDKDKNTLCTYKREEAVLDKKLKIPFKIDTIAKENNVEIMKVAFAVVNVDVDEELVNEPSRSVRLKVMQDRKLKPWKISSNALKFLKNYEDLKLKMYNDDADNATIGYGHLIHYGLICGDESENPFKNGLNEDKAMILLKNDLKKFENTVNKYVTVELFQYEYDALVIFCFNIGRGAFKNSTALKVLNKKQYSKVGSKIKLFDKITDTNGHKIVSKGLLNRRTEEVEIFEKGDYVRTR